MAPKIGVADTLGSPRVKEQHWLGDHSLAAQAVWRQLPQETLKRYMAAEVAEDLGESQMQQMSYMELLAGKLYPGEELQYEPPMEIKRYTKETRCATGCAGTASRSSG